MKSVKDVVGELLAEAKRLHAEGHHELSALKVAEAGHLLLNPDELHMYVWPKPRGGVE